MADPDGGAPPGRALFLHGDLERAHNDNHILLPAAFRRSGWTVALAPYTSLVWQPPGVHCDAGPVEGFDLIWLLGFGTRETFLDRMQLLMNVPARRFVTAPSAFLQLHGKLRWLDRMPVTFIGQDAARLAALAAAYEREHGTRRWLLKPTAGSYGRQIVELEGGTALPEALAAAAARGAVSPGLLLLQCFEPAVAAGEMRALWAGRRLIGAYRREPGPAGRNNLAAGGRATAATLDGRDERLVRDIGRDLDQLGVGYAAIDVSSGFLVEVNIANPGGLGTLLSLTGEDAAGAVAKAVGALSRQSGRRQAP